MTELLPYFAGIVTLLFGFAFFLSLQEFKEVIPKETTDED